MNDPGTEAMTAAHPPLRLVEESSGRRPKATIPRRIQSLATLPVFLKLTGRRAVIVGGTEAALWKAELLAAAGAHVDVYGKSHTKDFRTLAAGVPFNVIDRPAFCDLEFGAIVNRSPLVVAISTDGAAPVFGQAIRAKIE